MAVVALNVHPQLIGDLLAVCAAPHVLGLDKESDRWNGQVDSLGVAGRAWRPFLAAGVAEDTSEDEVKESWNSVSPVTAKRSFPLDLLSALSAMPSDEAIS
jgi:hypothetical protein